MDDDDAEMMSDRLNDYEQKCCVSESDRVNEDETVRLRRQREVTM